MSLSQREFFRCKNDQEERILLAPDSVAHYWSCLNKAAEEAIKEPKGDVSYWLDRALLIVEEFERQNLPHPMTCRLPSNNYTNS
jgi:hypothetical protein